MTFTKERMLIHLRVKLAEATLLVEAFSRSISQSFYINRRCSQVQGTNCDELMLKVSLISRSVLMLTMSYSGFYEVCPAFCIPLFYISAYLSRKTFEVIRSQNWELEFYSFFCDRSFITQSPLLREAVSILYV